MLIVAISLVQGVVSGQTPPIPVIHPVPLLPQAELLPASAKAVVDHIGALYRGDIDAALTFVAEGVENSVSDLKSSRHVPSGRAVTKAMYLSITRNGALPLAWFACRPEAELVRCEMHFGRGKAMRDFTIRYRANGGPITQVYSWENHHKEK